jgi:HSP20 family protein
MSLARRYTSSVWDPFREFQEVSERLSRIFANGAADNQQTLRSFDWAPAVNISETEKAYLVKADLPEVKKEDVKITHENGVLTIEGERRQSKREESEKYHRVESSYGRFFRRFTLPEDVQDDEIQASFEDGSLSVVIPKAQVREPKARQIGVS